ncbi:MAG TPA: sigma 54-interacting transcriptional regulator [Candidatus Sulfotelmatobacter sp.]|jgi:formate hydrogenlyase transcriptional activator
MSEPASFGFDNALLRPAAFSDPERVLEAYYGSSTVGLAILDTEHRYLAVNCRLAEINGVPAPEHLGKTIKEVLGDFADAVAPKLQRAISEREPVNFEISAMLPARNEPACWIVHYLPILNATGDVSRVGAVVVETTAEKMLERSLHDVDSKLHKEMDRLQMVLDVSKILATTWNLQHIFPQISARIRRVLWHEYAGFELYEANTGLLIRQAEDFPLGKGLLTSLPISPHNSPGGHALQMLTPLIFSKDQMLGFEAEITKNFLAEGLQSLCCVPLALPNGALGVLELASTRANAFQPEDLTLLNQVGAQFALALENHRAAAEIETLKERLADEKKYLEGETRPKAHFSEIVGDSPALHKVLDQISTVAPSHATVLILGETGTGKELVARAIHRLSRREEGPFIKVNCAAIPTGLLESELFGHEKGAFTGAVSQKVGRMELADGGTLFLDEVGEIPLELQPKLLRVLQDQEFERLGSNRTIKVNLRLIAATNRDLARGIALHEFRSDLFYRLSVFPIRVPPLRERREDIPLLVRHYVHKFAQRMERPIETIPRETMKALTEWSWPGNVRELENLMERSVILSDGNALHVPLSEMHSEVHLPSAQNHTLDSAEREHILRVLRETRGTIAGPDGAARRLGLKRTTLQSKMQRLKINRQDYMGS